MAKLTPRRALIFGLPALAVGCVPRHARQDTLIYSLDREVIALRQQNDRLTERLGSCAEGQDAPPAIYTELVQILPDLGVEVWRQGNAVHLRVPGDRLFAPSSTRLLAESAPTLDLLSTAMGLHPRVSATVLGHTDSAPVRGRLARSYPTNWELSIARGLAVVRALTEEWGVGPHRLTPAGRSHWDPIADNDTTEGRAKNRRVEIILKEGKERT